MLLSPRGSQHSCTVPQVKQQDLLSCCGEAPPSRGRKPSRDPKPGKPEPEGATPKELKHPESKEPTPWSLIILEAIAAALRAHKLALGITQGHGGNGGKERETGSSLITRGLSAVASRQVQPHSPLNPKLCILNSRPSRLEEAFKLRLRSISRGGGLALKTFRNPKESTACLSRFTLRRVSQRALDPTSIFGQESMAYLRRCFLCFRFASTRRMKGKRKKKACNDQFYS